MNIVRPYARIVYPDFNDLFTSTQMLRRIEAYGRVSHRSEEAQTDDSWKRFISAVVIQHGDYSIIEHEHVTVEARVDRGITHEWVRHRLGAYTQESTRFVNYEKKMPPSFINPYESERSETWEQVIQACEQGYKDLLASGCTPQIARSVFPNALASKLIVTYNLRMWRHFFIMRCSKEAHPQMREVTIPLLSEFKNRIPVLYDDITPNNRQVEMMRLPR